MWYLPLSDLTSLSMMISAFICIAANGNISFFWGLSSIPLCVCVCIYLFFIYLSVIEHLGCFHALAIVSSATMNIGVHISF